MIVAGMGFRAGTTVESFASALARWPHHPDALATADAKAADPNLQAFAAAQGVPIIAVPRAVLRSQATRTQSVASQAAYGTGSVAEAAALAGVGAGGYLLGARVISADRSATCALARSATRPDVPDPSRENEVRDPE